MVTGPRQSVHLQIKQRKKFKNLQWNYKQNSGQFDRNSEFSKWTGPIFENIFVGGSSKFWWSSLGKKRDQ